MSKLFLHDYAGHAFTVQLARALASRGYDVLYVYFKATIHTPKGNLAPRADDPSNLRLVGLDIGAPLSVNSLTRRRFQDLRFARAAAGLLRGFAPDLVLSACSPPEVHILLMRAARVARASFVFWIQDLWGVGAHETLRQTTPWFGSIIGYVLERLERRLFLKSDATIAISPEFADVAISLNADPAACHVIPNWGVVDELPLLSKDNAWSRQFGLNGKTCLLYAGTLGRKHDASILIHLSAAFRDRPDVRVVVVSQGHGAAALQQHQRASGLDNLVVLPYQPFERLPEVLATGSVLLAVLQPGASDYSVPSKVLSYLCAGRALLLSMPARNLSAQIVAEAGAGLCVEPGDTSAYIAEARRLIEDDETREAMGAAARRYAERKFAIEPIAARFDEVLAAVRLRNRADRTSVGAPTSDSGSIICRG